MLSSSKLVQNQIEDKLKEAKSCNNSCVRVLKQEPFDTECTCAYKALKDDIFIDFGFCAKLGKCLANFFECPLSKIFR